MHESQASWEKFRDDTLNPTLPTVQGGLEGPPQEQAFEIYKLMP